MKASGAKHLTFCVSSFQTAPTGFCASLFSATKLPRRSSRSNTVSRDLCCSKWAHVTWKLTNGHTFRSASFPHGEAGQPGGGAGGRRVEIQTNWTAAGFHTVINEEDWFLLNTLHNLYNVWLFQVYAYDPHKVSIKWYNLRYYCKIFKHCFWSFVFFFLFLSKHL